MRMPTIATQWVYGAGGQTDAFSIRKLRATREYQITDYAALCSRLLDAIRKRVAAFPDFLVTGLRIAKPGADPSGEEFPSHRSDQVSSPLITRDGQTT